MKYPARILILSLLASGLCACAISHERPLTLEEELELKHYRIGAPANMVRNYRMSGWSYVNDRHIIINTGPSRQYLVGFKNKCIETRSAVNVAFTNTSGRLTTFDKLLVNGPGNLIDQCYIQSITHLKKINRDSPDKAY